ncbi:MAG TPA: 2'-5' RNA ligase family protein [Thermomicrobiales bacterium]|jgi:hypothetical protein|nr:2'-5' RNA ligase family protein [Thermomicrobiales bacterium]
MTSPADASTTSPAGRRIVAAVVTGEIGEAVQRWREEHDPAQARRLPPHATLCYWAPTVEPELLERQVRHALPAPVSVRLRAVRHFANKDRTLYLPVEETTALDDARVRLYDGTYLALTKDHDWDWHVTVVRYGRHRQTDWLLAEGVPLPDGGRWTIDTVAYMELRDGVYHDLARWQL